MSEEVRPCEICGQPIEADRLELLTDTRLCVAHARAIGKYGGEFILSASLDRTSKQGSLKKNYGGVTAFKRRNHEGMARLRDEYTGNHDNDSAKQA